MVMNRQLWRSRLRHNKWIDLGDEGGLFGGDLCLCGAVADFFGELGGRGFGLDDGSGSLVSVSRK